MKENKFINIDPIGKPRMTQRDKWKVRPIVARYRAFADQLRYKCNLKGITITDSLECTFVIAMPKSWSKKKKAQMMNTPHRQKPDIDNIIKAILDPLLKDDSGVYYVNCLKQWGEQGKIIFKS